MDLNAIWTWMCANPIIVAMMVITEALPFLPGKSNGIAQGILNLLGKIKGAPTAMIILLIFALSGCAGQSPQVTTGKTLIAMHDFVKAGAVATDALCGKGIIKPEPCAAIKVQYDKTRVVWPMVDDALVVYLKADPQDPVSLKTFQGVYAVFMQNYSELTTLFIQQGVVKEVQ
jgi:hypothetical protein